MIIGFAVALVCFNPVWAGADRVIGQIDGIHFEGDRPYLTGWACQQGQSAPILVHIYADNSPNDPTKTSFVTFGKADLPSESRVCVLCGDHESSRHRFKIYLPAAAFANGQERTLFVHGVRVAGNVANAEIGGSGTIKFKYPSVPAFAGTYVRSKQHPCVFTTLADLNDLVARINTAGTFSAQRFVQLASQIKKDVTDRIAWSTAYAGTDEDVYLHAFAFEAKPSYSIDKGDDAYLSAAMHIPAGIHPPKGAAVVASRLALYAALVKAGAVAPADAPTADQTAALAKQILLAWSGHGFRDERGNFMHVSALMLSRGVIYSVDAQDLLEGLGALTPDERAQLDHFHRIIYDQIRVPNNAGLIYLQTSASPDQAYSNGFANAVAALLALSRLYDDQEGFYATLYGGQGASAVDMPLAALFDRVVYGVNDTPLQPVAVKANADPPTAPDYTTAIVAPGEINDRYRNDNPAQGIGYSMFTLERLLDAAEIMRIAGLDFYGYRGRHGQSLEMAIQYYAGLAKGAGFYGVVNAKNCGSYPNAPQYYGKIVNGVDPNVVLGAYRYPKNAGITSVEAAAKVASSSGPFTLDAVLFGKWRD